MSNGKAKTVFVCQACGRIAARRDDFKDSSCRTWGVECWESSIQRDCNGRVTGATAIVDSFDLTTALPELPTPITDVLERERPLAFWHGMLLRAVWLAAMFVFVFVLSLAFYALLRWLWP